MQRIIYFVLIPIFSSCSYKIIRSSYQLLPKDQHAGSCIIKKDMANKDSLQKVGEIRLEDGGFANDCSEATGIKILKEEAKKIGAHIINIIEEKRPKLTQYGGSREERCYECRAEFFRVTAVGSDYLDELLNRPENINNNIKEYKSGGKSDLTTAFVILIVIGFSAGMVAVILK